MTQRVYLSTERALPAKGFEPAPYNPRSITQPRLAALGRSLETYGDLSGLVVNIRSSRIIGGHQRAKHLPPDSLLVPTEVFSQPNPQGTVGLGYVEVNGERWRVRFVDVSADREKEMNLAANAHGGEWEQVALAPLLADMQSQGMDLELVGFSAAFLRSLQAEAEGGYDRSNPGALAAKFLIPPFNVFNAREGWWQQRKDSWLGLGIRSELGRGESLLNFSKQVIQQTKVGTKGKRKARGK